MGRPLVPIDWEMIKRMAHIHCTQDEIAHNLNISVDTLANRCPKEMGCTFSEYIKRGAAGGKMSLRRWQWKSAEAGNVTMQIWLAKNHLDQSDQGPRIQGNATLDSEQQEANQLAQWLAEVDELV